MEKKYIDERFKSFTKALESLKRAKERDLSDEFVMSGTVQKFSICFDIAWKIMKDISVNYFKVTDFATGSPRESLRVAYSVKLISDDNWMNMLEDRNQLAHDYDGRLADEKTEVIVYQYIPLIDEFHKNVKTLMEKHEA